MRDRWRPTSTIRELDEMQIPVRGVLEFGVYGTDLAELEGFYCRVFGLTVIARAADRLVSLRCGNSTIILFNPEVTRVPGPIPEHGPAGSGHLAFIIADEERTAWRERLAALGVPIEKEVEWQDGGASIYLRDPAGNSIELAPPTIWGGLGRDLLASLDGG